MKPYLRALHAEFLKLRGTLALRMAFVAPLLVVAVLSLQLLAMHTGNESYPAQVAWSRYANGVTGLWTFLMLPLYITLQAALLANLEHAHQQWKHLLALPLPRGAHYLAKAIVLLSLLALASVVLLLGIPIGGWLLMVLKPSLGISGAPPLVAMAVPLGSTLAAALVMLALQLWIALRWQSFTVAVAVGMSATVMGFLIGQSDRYGPLFPWSLPTWTIAGDAVHLPQVLTIGLLGGAGVLLFGLWEFERRDMA